MATYVSPQYSITAPWVNDVRRILRSGWIGTTRSCKDWLESRFSSIPEDGLKFAEIFKACSLELSCDIFIRSSCSETPRACGRSDLVRLRAVGKLNSWGMHPGAWMIQPRIIREPDSVASPLNSSCWEEFGATTTDTLLQVNGTPSVLSCRDRWSSIRGYWKIHLSVTDCSSKAIAQGLWIVTITSIRSFWTISIRFWWENG